MARMIMRMIRGSGCHMVKERKTNVPMGTFDGIYGYNTGGREGKIRTIGFFKDKKEDKDVAVSRRVLGQNVISNLNLTGTNVEALDLLEKIGIIQATQPRRHIEEIIADANLNNPSYIIRVQELGTNDVELEEKFRTKLFQNNRSGVSCLDLDDALVSEDIKPNWCDGMENNNTQGKEDATGLNKNDKESVQPK
nr:hypothetical protein [Tanacetum cinerariifolium]